MTLAGGAEPRLHRLASGIKGMREQSNSHHLVGGHPTRQPEPRKPGRLSLLLVVFVLGSCGGGAVTNLPENQGATSVLPPSPVATVAQGQQSPSDESAVGHQGETTLSEFLGIDDVEVVRSRALRQHEAVEGLTAQCMADAGFVYRAMPFEDPVDEDSPSPREYASLYGFGVVTGMMGVTPGAGDGPIDDPNLAGLSVLSVGERESWERALLGTEEGPGCAQSANETVFGRIEEAWDSVRPILDEYERRINTDQAYVESRKKWSACLGDATGSGAVDDGATLHQWVQDVIQDEAASLFEANDTNGLTALLGREVEVAVAVSDCDAALDRSLQMLRPRYEEVMLRENRAVFEQLLSALNNPLG